MIDTHCHLQDLDFKAEVDRAQSAGVDKFICNSSGIASSQKAVEIAEKFSGVLATVGLGYDRPTIDLNKARDELTKLATSPLVVAVGESGLDDPPQIELFDWHIQLAQELNLPLVVHCRNAFSKIYERIQIVRVQMHCWTGDWDWAKKFLNLGCYLSFGGIVTFKSSHELREVVKKVPTDRLLLETDSPYISPEPLRGKPNSPANLKYIARVVAAIRGISIAELDHITTANAYSLFPKLKEAKRL